MRKQVTKIEDLSPDQLRAQVRLCFKFMEQCLSVLNGEDVSEESVIKLVDPIGESSDMELFYKCKGIAGDDTIYAQDIEKLQKENQKLRERLARKHNAEESNFKKFAEQQAEIGRLEQRICNQNKEIRDLKEKKKENLLDYELRFNTDKFKGQIEEACKYLRELADSMSRLTMFDFPNPKAYDEFKKMFEDIINDLPKAIAEAIADEAVDVAKRDAFFSKKEIEKLCDCLYEDACNHYKKMLKQWRSFEITPIRVSSGIIGNIMPRPINFIGEVNQYIPKYAGDIASKLDIVDSFKCIWKNLEIGKPVPKFNPAQKVFFMVSNVVESGKIWYAYYDNRKSCYIYHIKGNKTDHEVEECDLFKTVEELLADLKHKIQNG